MDACGRSIGLGQRVKKHLLKEFACQNVKTSRSVCQKATTSNTCLSQNLLDNKCSTSTIVIVRPPGIYMFLCLSLLEPKAPWGQSACFVYCKSLKPHLANIRYILRFKHLLEHIIINRILSNIAQIIKIWELLNINKM